MKGFCLMKKGSLKAVIQNNHSCKEFLDYLLETYKETFSEDEKQNIVTIQTHLINLSVVFSKVK
jgi:DUF438 domain-containing protein